MNKKFKPCLFCGSTDIDILTYDEEYHTRKVAECINCGARGSVSDSDEEAIESWNTRPMENEMNKVIENFTVELNNLQHFCDSIFEMAKRNNGVLYFTQDNGTWKIETGEDNDVPINNKKT
jgi:Lar family restriction alleviation protein